MKNTSSQPKPRESALPTARRKASARVLAKTPVHSGLASRTPQRDLLAQARRNWADGDWNALREIELGTLEQHSSKDRIALIVACGHQMVNLHESARRLLRCALAWGCPPRLAAEFLISGVHNTIGRIAALRDDKDGVALNFDKALGFFSGADGRSASVTRAVREMAGMGLLPQALNLVRQEVDGIDVMKTMPSQLDARLSMLQTEVQLLSHELTLAQERNQLRVAPSDSSKETEIESLSDLKRRSPSQLGQDLWVLDRCNFKRGGFFVEFGATDGVLLSNTLLLEREFGWTGICAEPNPKFFKSLRANRSCASSNACIGEHSGNLVEFVFADAYGGMQVHAASDMHAKKREAYRKAGLTAQLHTVSLHDLLVEFRAPREIDYLSIDTEGSELEVLRGFPFDLWSVRFITVEHNFTPAREQIRALLESKGYRRTEARWDDWYELVSRSSE